ncbi:MAG: hypothetical protein U1E02_28245, partial [Hydrogenophaga sp.]|nr:hypothetical protein [Hydrogenophaga sp.]
IVGGEWYFEEFTPGNGVHGLGLQDPWPGAVVPESNPAASTAPAAAPVVEDRRGILDLFRN